MNAVLETLLSVSYSGSVIIALVLLFRLVLKDAPKRYVCLLWLLVAVRLLVPLRIESSMSLQPNVEDMMQQRPEIWYDDVAEGESEGVAVDLPVSSTPAQPPIEQTEQVTPGINSPQQDIANIPTEDIIFSIWAAVSCGFLVYTAVSYGVLRYRVRNATALDTDVYESAEISSPFLLGYFCPRIYLPKDLPLSDLEHILAHERMHIRRKDNWIKLVMFVCVAIHWFNPLVWVAYGLLCKDMEMACDEEVVRDLTLEGRKAYSKALVNCAANMRMISACPVAFGEVSVKERILKVLSYRKPVFWVSLAAIVAIVFVVVCFMTDPAAPKTLTGMEWLRQVDAEDVASIRFTEGRYALSYTDYDAAEIPEVLDFLRQCDGQVIQDSYLTNVGTINRYFYVTMTDGTVHTLMQNDGYVTIDGIPYNQCDEWLSLWPKVGRTQRDMVQLALEILEKTRTQDSIYLQQWTRMNEKKPRYFWLRANENWYQLTEEDGVYKEDLVYEGQSFHREYQKVGPDVVTETTGWLEAAKEPTFSLPWPLDEKQDPADYQWVKTVQNTGEVIVTLRYLPDGAELELHYFGDGWLEHYEARFADGSEVSASLLNPSGFGKPYQLQQYYLQATDQHEALFNGGIQVDPEDAQVWEEQVWLAMEAFHAADGYSLIQTDSVYTSVFNESKLYVWNIGENWLRQYSSPATTEYYLRYDGRCYKKTAATMVTDTHWQESSEETIDREIRSWLEDFQWDGESIYCSSMSQYGGVTQFVCYRLDETAKDGYYRFIIELDAQGRLARATKSWVELDGSANYSYEVMVNYQGDGVGAYIEDFYGEVTGE